MRTILLGKTQEKLPVIGQGTWGIQKGKNAEYYQQWKASLQRGIELGMTHLDTAEIYGNGAAEKVVGEVIKENKREDLFITSKLFPTHVSERSMQKAIKKSLERLGIPCLDLYLIHWPSPIVPVKKHVRIMESFLKAGQTRYIGVSNFSLERFQAGQEALASTELVNNQLHVNLNNQKHIQRSLPYYQQNGITMTAYSPLGHKGFKNLNGSIGEKVNLIAQAHHASVQEIAIAWLVNLKSVMTIPKAFQLKHVESNARVAEIKLTDAEMKDLTIDAPVERAIF